MKDDAMLRSISRIGLLVVLCGFVCTACAREAEITDPAQAQKDPDFAIQGEYQGEGTWAGGDNVKVGAQVIALGKGQFTAVVTKGGLPGNGWKRGEPRFSLIGKRQDNAVKLLGRVALGSGADNVDGTVSGQIAGEAMTVTGDDGKTKLELKRGVRHSATEGAKPPEGAVVLFDGTTGKNFKPGVLLPDGNLLSNETSKQQFGDYALHLEFRLSYMPEARGQARSNSGVYLHNCYEIQVLDSFGLEGEDNECGGFYQLRKPDVNMCYPPLTWQTYDVDFVAPKYKDGKKVSDARVEVRHNGVVIHPEFDLAHATPGRDAEGPAPRPLYLQGHGNKIEYRNIWLKERQ
jgi:hypothetical protein